MKIAIVGGGWVGCHLANKFRNDHEVVIFEKNPHLFTETSYNNQNRLHQGFHYARSFETRELCHNTFGRFLTDYSFASKPVNNNWYCVAKNKSIIDFQTYLKIFDDFEFNVVNHGFELFEGCINTQEKYIDFNKIYEFFNDNLYHVQSEITTDKIEELQTQYDLVVNATNNHIIDTSISNFYYELTLSLIYKKNNTTSFDALTVVDGDLFSIYPYKEDLYTVTDVEYTPLKQFKNIQDLKTFQNQLVETSLVEQRRVSIEKKIQKYYPKFLHNFQYESYFTSTKSKIKVSTDSRYPIITKSGNLINCFTGKIQGIYLIEDYIKNVIQNT